MRILVIIGIIAMTALLIYSTTGLPVLFDPASPASTHVSPRYIERSYEETGTRNFVTAILANYRAYDTLGEVVVVFTAALATVFILKPLGSFASLGNKRKQRQLYRMKREEEKREEEKREAEKRNEERREEEKREEEKREAERREEERRNEEKRKEIAK